MEVLSDLGGIRITGFWPLPRYGLSNPEVSLPVSSVCGVKDVTVAHCLCHCPGTAGFFSDLIRTVLAPGRQDVAALMLLVFGPCALPADRLKHIAFVAQSVHTVVSQLGSEEASNHAASGVFPPDLLDEL